MAAAIVCDKCGTSNRDIDKFMHIRAYRFKSSESFMNVANKHMDVCKECYSKIFNEEEHK